VHRNGKREGPEKENRTVQRGKERNKPGYFRSSARTGQVGNISLNGKNVSIKEGVFTENTAMRRAGIRGVETYESS